jgi:hypothetical protein
LCFNLQSLIEVHDDVASKNFEVLPVEAFSLVTAPLSPTLGSQTFILPTSGSLPNLPQDAVRMVGIAKKPDEALVSC